MFSSILSADVRGITGVPIFVETDISDGLPGLTMVGYLTSAVKESADRVRTALKNTGITMPPKKVTVNLSPADAKKEGTGFDLAIAVSMMCSLGIFPQDFVEKILFLGELGLDGSVKKIRGVLPMVEMAKESGCRACVLPKENLPEGQIVEDIVCVGVESLRETMDKILQCDFKASKKDAQTVMKDVTEDSPDFDQIRGQESV